MPDDFLNRNNILSQLETILDFQVKIAEYIDKRLCRKCDAVLDESWEEKRKEAFKYLRGLIDKYAFSKRLPRNDLGMMTQSIISHLLNIQHTMLRVLVLIDMMQEEPFNEIFMDSMTTISSKVLEMMTSLKLMIKQREEHLEESELTLELVIKLERQIDEDNIVICR
ncbi:MAG: hypothetical protein E4H14_16985, partial [Candidatus Thorarchaeota archaeon]